MKTLFALGILVAACTFGRILIGAVALIMGFAAIPGALLYKKGLKAYNGFLLAIGFLLTLLCELYIVGAYSVFLVTLLRIFTIARPGFPAWPLWIAAFIHTGAVPMGVWLQKKTTEDEINPALYPLGFVTLLAEVIFFISIFAPAILRPVYGWVPYFGHLLK